MADELLAAIVGGILGLVGTLIAIYHEEIANLAGRERRLAAHWKGHSIEYSLSPGSKERESEYYFTWLLRQRGRSVSGTVVGGRIAGREGQLSFTGKILHSSYLQLSFKTDDPRQRDFGVVLLHIDDLGGTMDGFGVANDVGEPGLVVFQVTVKRAGISDDAIKS